MPKPSIVAQGDDKDIDEKKGPVTLRRCKKDEANPGHTRPSDDDGPGAIFIYQMTDERTLNSSFEAGCAVQEGNSGAACPKIALQGQEEDGETVVENPSSNGANDGAEDDDPPAVKYSAFHRAKDARHERMEEIAV